MRLALGPAVGFDAVHLVPFDGPPPRRGIIVVRTPLGLVAYWNVCQHLPLPLDGGLGAIPVEDGAMVCNAHGARYRPLDGECIEGPCEGLRLVRIPLEEEDGIVYAKI